MGTSYEKIRMVSRSELIEKLNKADRYVSSGNLKYIDTGKEYPSTEVFIVDDVYDIIDDLEEFTYKPRTCVIYTWYTSEDYGTYVESTPHCKCSNCETEFDPYTIAKAKYCSVCGNKIVNRVPLPDNN